MTSIPAILAVDQGTTRTKALIFDAAARCLTASASEVPLTYPHPGWVEQDPRDLLQAMARDMGHPIKRIKVDGGASVNRFLMQSLADITDAEVCVAAIPETTALGAAPMSGLRIGLWHNTAETARLWRKQMSYIPHTEGNIDGHYERWSRAVALARGWAAPVSSAG